LYLHDLIRWLALKSAVTHLSFSVLPVHEGSITQAAVSKLCWG